jgi:anti-anti-sigma regulatory factor
MSTIPKLASFVIDGEHLPKQLQEIGAELANEGPEILLDFFLAQSLNPADIHALEQLAAAANLTNTKIVLRGVSVEMYKVFKLAGLSEKLAFID